VFLTKILKKIQREVWITPQFYVPIGIGLCVFFLPATFILGFELCTTRQDSVPDATTALLWAALGFSIFILLIGLSLVFFGTRWSAVPGTFLHRITHLRSVRRG